MPRVRAILPRATLWSRIWGAMVEAQLGRLDIALLGTKRPDGPAVSVLLLDGGGREQSDEDAVCLLACCTGPCRAAGIGDLGPRPALALSAMQGAGDMGRRLYMPTAVREGGSQGSG